MFYIIYITTNKINNKIYIGHHKTSNLNDNYLGSGKALKRAIRKYGRDKFDKRILFIFDNRKEMVEKEAELVDALFIERKDVYNIKLGGSGGFDYINENRLSVPQTKEFMDMIRKLPPLEERLQNLLKSDEKRLANLKEKYPNGTWFNRTHSEESKNKISEARKNTGIGVENSQFGSFWITDGFKNKKLKQNDMIPIGWYKGRINCNQHKKIDAV